MRKFAIRLHTEQILFKYARGIYEQREKEIHTRHELFFLMDGQAEFISEFGHKKIAPGTLVVVPKETFHQFVTQGDETAYTRCVFKFAAPTDLEELIQLKCGGIRFIEDAEIAGFFEKLKGLCTSDHSQLEKQILLKSYLAQVLVSIKDADATPADDTAFMSTTTKKVIQYIRGHIADDLTLQNIAEQLHISTSHLAHQFKKEMQMPLHKYVLNKRLTLAHKKISQHVPATRAAEECGFRDYSNFFVQYKKQFGHPPSHHKPNAELSQDKVL